jgi:NitT/TauT family transport system substrate-binding protein
MLATVRRARQPSMWLTTLMIALILVLAGCAGTVPPAQAPAPVEEGAAPAEAPEEAEMAEELPTVIFQAFPADPAAIPLLIMQNEGIDEQYGFHGELLTVDPDAAMNTFLIGESDVATEQDIVTTAIARQEGHETVTFYPVLNMMTGIVVPEDSPYETPEDLVGEKVGHFGVDSGTTTGIAAMLKELYDINVYEDYDLREVGPEALPELLAGGEVEAIFDFQPLLVRAVLITPGRYLFHPYLEWSERTGGWAPWLTNLVAKKEWIRNNPDLAIGVRDAWAEAQQMIIDSNYDLLGEDPYGSFLELRNEEELQGLIEYCRDMVPCYASSWTQDDLKQAQDWVKIMADNDLLVEEVPEEPVAVILEDFLGR